MAFYLQEKIGNPELFTGRKKELAFLMNWVEKIKPQLSKSMAIISRRKTGKTALLQRLYNIIVQSNNGVIPFYYEIKELRDKLNLQMNESDLEKKLQSLVNADIIEQGDSNFYYQGVQDNIFDKVFRSKYEDDIKTFDPKDIIKEYQAMNNTKIMKHSNTQKRLEEK